MLCDTFALLFDAIATSRNSSAISKENVSEIPADLISHWSYYSPLSREEIKKYIKSFLMYPLLQMNMSLQFKAQ